MSITHIPLILASSQSSSFRQGLLPILIGTTIVVGVSTVYYYLTRRHQQVHHRRSWWARALYLMFLAVILVLSATSLGSVLNSGVMQHYALLAHVTAAGAFVFLLLPIAAITLPRSLRNDRTWWLETCSAWVLILGSLVTAGTMLISMLPALDTDGLLQFTELHRYAGLITAVAALVHLVSLAIRHFGIR